jgi:hypothetical protein
VLEQAPGEVRRERAQLARLFQRQVLDSVVQCVGQRGNAVEHNADRGEQSLARGDDGDGVLGLDSLRQLGDPRFETGRGVGNHAGLVRDLPRPGDVTGQIVAELSDETADGAAAEPWPEYP